MVGFKAKARALAFFAKLGCRRGCVFVGGVCVRGGGYICVYGWDGWGVLKGWECIGRRGRRETTPLYHICYIKGVLHPRPKICHIFRFLRHCEENYIFHVCI